MKKIDLFYILAYEEQTKKYEKKIQAMIKLRKEDKKVMESTLLWHFFMLSNFFNLRNFYEYEGVMQEYENPMIYHIPFGKDDQQTLVEEKLLKYKGTIPIVMRSYDAHSPIKTSLEYMVKYHDLILTYLTKRVDRMGSIMFAQLCYDNHFAYMVRDYKERDLLACMILRKESRDEYLEKSIEFKKKGLDLEKTYHLRNEIVDFEEVDIYGRNWPQEMSNYKGTLYPHMKKYQIMEQYTFNIIVENTVTENYISEKILDSFLTLTIPVYLGSPKVKDD